ncbi:type II toxin-antitoxin system ParD family antitoxin [Starkeya sp. ORNL1]|uniref:type II toxin-antitoxin system ParD family antitoxin n=1 Tax=Starkeya sp. ORNL1 TaxID=2709380 RepID=UPI001463CE5E|nr:type II toxin-antitoxin system ParD family antitoxin [Starkeya sp. ORNL1]QJP15499.1 type II toxin-antitoxin system ParD family antitoxin [Starkeya sp. ORNL1]
MPRSFTLGEHFELFIDDQLASGRFNNASEVVRAGLRLLEEQHDLHRLKVEDIRRSIAESRQSGRTIPADEMFERLEARIRRLED